MTDERCKHDLDQALCVDCRPVPPGLTARVTVTGGGQVFHQSPDCRALREGRRHVEWRGASPDAAVVVTLGEAQASGRAACVVCFPYYRPGRSRPSAVASRAPRAVPPRAVDPLEELAAALDAARRAVAAAIASGADRRRLAGLVRSALLDIRAQVWPRGFDAGTPTPP